MQTQPPDEERTSSIELSHDLDERRALEAYVRVLNHELDRRKSLSLGFFLIEVLPASMLLTFTITIFLCCGVSSEGGSIGGVPLSMVGVFALITPIVYLLASKRRHGHMNKVSYMASNWDYMLEDIKGEETSVEDLEKQRADARVRLYGDDSQYRRPASWPNRFIGGLSISEDDQTRGAISQADEESEPR